MPGALDDRLLAAQSDPERVGDDAAGLAAPREPRDRLRESGDDAEQGAASSAADGDSQARRDAPSGTR